MSINTYQASESDDAKQTEVNVRIIIIQSRLAGLCGQQPAAFRLNSPWQLPASSQFSPNFSPSPHLEEVFSTRSQNCPSYKFSYFLEYLSSFGMPLYWGPKIVFEIQIFIFIWAYTMAFDSEQEAGPGIIFSPPHWIRSPIQLGVTAG